MGNLKSDLYSVPDKNAGYLRVELGPGESLTEDLDVTPQGLEVMIRSKTPAVTVVKVTRPFATARRAGGASRENQTTKDTTEQ